MKCVWPAFVFTSRGGSSRIYTRKPKQALISAGERTVQPLQGADVDTAQLSAVVNAEYSRLSAAIIMAAASSGPASAAPVGVHSKPVTPGYRR